MDADTSSDEEVPDAAGDQDDNSDGGDGGASQTSKLAGLQPLSRIFRPPLDLKPCVFATVELHLLLAENYPSCMLASAR